MAGDEKLLAICIPTFNRARYIGNLLETLHADIQGFPHSYEIVISDNASEDDTEAVVGQWLDKLPVRYFRQETNIGPHNSLAFAFGQSRGRYSMYLADDDLIDVPGLDAALTTLTSNPDAVILYAPWTLVDLVNDKTLSNFYELPGDTTVQRGNYLHMLSLILQNHIFAEIAIFQTDAFRRRFPRSNDLAHWAFTVPSEYLSVGNVIFAAKPFYRSVTNYFADERRHQLGTEEVEVSWDAYRGGLEHLLGLCISVLSEQNLELLRSSMHEFLIRRMLVALKFRIVRGRDPIETYYLASRLRGMGALSRLPKPFDEIRSEAALWFVTHDSTLVDGKTQIALVGGFDPSVAETLQSITDLDLLFFDTVPKGAENTLFIVKGSAASPGVDLERAKAASNKVFFETDLLNKFL